LLKKQGNLTGALNAFKAELKADPQNHEAIEQVAEIEGRLHGSNSNKAIGASESSNATEPQSNSKR
jgi:ferric-dicitrate binding protein FerR (iron transport regulator)